MSSSDPHACARRCNNLSSAWLVQVTRMMRSKDGDKPSSGGAIVLTSAAVSQLGTANHDVLAAAKGAVASMALGAASTYSEHNIRVNCVAPGLVQCAADPSTDTSLHNRVRGARGAVTSCFESWWIAFPACVSTTAHLSLSAVRRTPQTEHMSEGSGGEESLKGACGSQPDYASRLCPHVCE